MRVGVPEVDDQHRVLIGELNCLIADLEAVPTSEAFTDVLSRLGRDLTAHFSFEEQVIGGLEMTAQEVEEHLTAHTEILRQYTELNLDLMRMRSWTRGEVLEMIRFWIVDHIVVHDLRMRRYLPA
jgi:hemerythrin